MNETITSKSGSEKEAVLSRVQEILKEADYHSNYSNFFDLENILITALAEAKDPEIIAQLAHYYCRMDRVMKLYNSISCI